MLPEKSAGKVLQATVVAVGPGSVNPVRSSKLGLTLDQALLKGGGIRESGRCSMRKVQFDSIWLIVLCDAFL